MAYQRRYFPALTITTTAYGDKSVTTDKLADKAVTSPKVAPDTIDSEHVVDESLKSVDIKDGEIKSSDLASGAVTTDKIASQAVTADKLEASIREITRPLTPALDTDEIQDAKVTLAKLAPDSVDASKIKPGAVTASELNPDAVETVKIKDAAVTTDKIAPGAVTENKIGTDAVTGPKILNRCIGNTEIAIEGCHRENVRDEAINASKLAAEAVSTDKLYPGAVTDLKLNTAALALRHVESKDTRVIEYKEEFGGLDLSNRWQKVGAAGGIVTAGGVKGALILTGAVNGNDQRIDWALMPIGDPVAVNPTMTVWIPGRSAVLTHFTNEIGLYKDANNEILFYAHDVGGATPNWFAKCVSLGNPTSIDTGIAVTNDVQLLMFKVISGASVKFYIDGIEKAEVTTNIPSTFEMWPQLKITTRTAATRGFYVNYFSILSDRPAYA